MEWPLALAQGVGPAGPAAVPSGSRPSGPAAISALCCGCGCGCHGRAGALGGNADAAPCTARKRGRH